MRVDVMSVQRQPIVWLSMFAENDMLLSGTTSTSGNCMGLSLTCDVKYDSECNDFGEIHLWLSGHTIFI